MGEEWKVHKVNSDVHICSSAFNTLWYVIVNLRSEEQPDSLEIKFVAFQ